MPKSTQTIILQNTLTPFNLVNAVVVGLLTLAYGSTGDSRLVWDSFGVVTVVIANTILAIIQEVRAHRALEHASRLRPPKVTIRREHGIALVSLENLQLDDVVVVQRGDVIPGDGQVVVCGGAEIDTSLLTGESDPVHVQLHDHVQAGTACIAGYLEVRITALGDDTQAAHIEQMARRIDLRPSPLQQHVNNLFTWCFGLAIVLAGIDLVHEGGSALTNVESIRRAATLVLGMIPEGLVFFSTITLITGIVRMRRLGIIVQRLGALEGLASASVVCLDKTGTLTTNQLVLDQILVLADDSEEQCRITLSALAHAIGDPGRMADAFRTASHQYPILETNEVIPFSSSRKFSACRTSGNTWWTIGALEMVMTPHHPRWDAVQRIIRESDLEGSRIVIVTQSQNEAPVGPHTEPQFVVVLRDGIRQDAKTTLEMFAQMGIQQVILSGDAEPSVRDTTEQLQPSAADPIAIHARCSPREKQEIVNDLSTSHTVVMIGDGVNDVPAMKEADVGIAMPESAPAAMLAADIVLEQASFRDFPAMISEGRRAVRIVMGVAVLFMSKNAVLVVASALAALGIMPFPLSPRRGALLSLVGVAIPSLFLATQANLSSSTRHFLRELLTNVTVVSLQLLTAYGGVWLIFGTHTASSSLLLMTLISSLLAQLVVLDVIPSYDRRRLAVVSAATIVTVALLIILPTTIPILAVLQAYFEIGGLGLEHFTSLLTSIIIGVLSTAPSVFLLRDHYRTSTPAVA